MIEVYKSIHDNFTVEFKIGYNVEKDSDINNFSVKTWIFMPNSLAINRQTYTSDLFYRDLKVNTRLITPIFLLREIANKKSIPMHNLREAFEQLASNIADYNTSSYEYQVKMFLAIVRSSVRDTISYIGRTRKCEDIMELSFDYEKQITTIVKEYRSLRKIINVPGISEASLNTYRFGDEYLSNLIDLYSFKIINKHKTETNPDLFVLHNKLVELISRERAYRIEENYIVIDKNSPTNNREFVHRMNILKRFVDSDLFLVARKKQDAVITQQIYYSLAAGVSMIFATAIAFSFQRKYGNFTMPLFVALVVSYMLKDRIKDLMRFYFVNKQKTRYYDNKTTISIGNTTLGWSRESFDFISEEKIPKEVLDIRNRTPLLEAENKYNNEHIILYRKMVQLKKSVLDDSETYTTTGVNEIIRFNLSHLVQKMDDPKSTYNTVEENGHIEQIQADKIYYINYILHLEHNNQNEYKRYRIVCTRDGIIDIEVMR